MPVACSTATVPSQKFKRNVQNFWQSNKKAKSKKLFAACTAGTKKLVWFDKGGHSHMRINNTQAYDDAIVAFLEENQ